MRSTFNFNTIPEERVASVSLTFIGRFSDRCILIDVHHLQFSWAAIDDLERKHIFRQNARVIYDRLKRVSHDRSRKLHKSSAGNKFNECTVSAIEWIHRYDILIIF